MDSIAQTFHRYFELVPANTEELVHQALKLRYQVYCEELDYMDANDFPDGIEQDDYDNHAYHCLIRHKSSGQFAACVRLVVTDPNSNYPHLPFEAICGEGLDRNIFDPAQLPQNNIGEISRLTVHKNFRKRHGEKDKPYPLGSFKSQTDEQRNPYPLITFGLYMACVATSIEKNINHIFVLMEPRLARRLRILGMQFEQISSHIALKGMRAPYHIAPTAVKIALTPDLQKLVTNMQSTIANNEYVTNTKTYKPATLNTIP